MFSILIRYKKIECLRIVDDLFTINSVCLKCKIINLFIEINKKKMESLNIINV